MIVDSQIHISFCEKGRLRKLFIEAIRFVGTAEYNNFPKLKCYIINIFINNIYIVNSDCYFSLLSLTILTLLYLLT